MSKRKTKASTGASAAWFWAGDSATGHQDVWIAYDAATTRLLETGYQNGDKEVKVDTERFIDMKNKKKMGQRRYDAPDRVRKVKREEVEDNSGSAAASGGSASASAAAATPTPAAAAAAAPAAAASSSGTPLWQWAGDSGGGSQNTWIDYSDAMNQKLEAALTKGEEKVQVDKERYVDLSGGTYTQRRYDDPAGKVRLVHRLVACPATGGPAAKIAKVGGGGFSSTTAAATPAPAPAAAAAAGGGGGTMVKQVVKGKAPVDTHSGVDSTHHVHYESDKEVYDAMLNQTNIGMNNNKFYLIQLLAPDAGTKGSYYVWTRWGRVGVVGQSSLQACSDLSEAKRVYGKKFQDKTGNDWDDRENFVKYGGKYALIHRDYGTDAAAAAGTAAVAAVTSAQAKVPDSTLPSPVQELVKLVCNVEMVKQSMLEIGYDASRMPLGKLGKDTIKQGYSALQKISTALTAKAARSKLSELSSEFYTVIPHSFGMSLPPVIDSQEMLKQKLEMIAALSDAALATSLLAQQSHSGANPIDEAHAKLNSLFTPVDHVHADFKMVETYIRNTHCPSHNQYTLQLLDLFRIARDGEATRFAKHASLHNRQLLWHGSRLSNYVGIISQGLRIAPPEAPVTGYMFGKGLYAANCSSKSANYCCTNRTHNTGLLLLCSIALGDMLELKHADYNAGDLCRQKNKHSTIGVGKSAPDPAQNMVLADGTIVPLGTLKPTGINDSSLLYPEFIVYDVAQVRIDYVVKVKFHYK